ncbi:hypothetical protein [Pannonibacter sp. P2PFMT1]|uniref:hypothetical protein n=1 Tax=Pannonibacter sp. P2PFMT1 TaxID=2003582 RepID=UPI001647068B|nr:hypothetical protein [Pannonibacter sp. P2PFMT1]
MKKREIANALSSLIEVLQKGDRVFLVAEISPDKLDDLCAAGAEAEDFEEDDPPEYNGDEFCEGLCPA